MPSCSCQSGGDSLRLYAFVGLALLWAGPRIFRNWRIRSMSEGKKAPSAAVKALIVVALVAAVGAVIFAKSISKNGVPDSKPSTAVEVTSAPSSADLGALVVADTGKPRLLDLGSVTCIPCKMMAPILEDLKTEYAAKMDVEFIDVWQDASAGKKYDVELIPTQIFFDASGKERYRHQGFFAKEDILAKWKELGVDLPASPATVSSKK
jgi:thioredoxin 1